MISTYQSIIYLSLNPVYLLTYPLFYLSIYLPIYLPTYLPIYLSIYIHPCTYISIYESNICTYLCVCMYVCWYDHLYFCLLVSLLFSSVCLSILLDPCIYLLLLRPFNHCYSHCIKIWICVAHSFHALFTYSCHISSLISPSILVLFTQIYFYVGGSFSAL